MGDTRLLQVEDTPDGLMLVDGRSFNIVVRPTIVAEADARRLAACWNLLCGVPTEVVERGAQAAILWAVRNALKELP